MKKTIIAVAGVMLAATAAQAEHKLLITDVLNQKQVEAQARFEYAHGSRNFTEAGEKGKQTVNVAETNFSVGAGLGYGLEITASLPYVISEREKEEIAGASIYPPKVDGFGDLSVEAKYLALGGEGKPLNLVVGLGAKFDTARRKDAGTGTSDISPFVAASYNLGHHYVPYAGYRATLRNHDAEDTHTLTVGLEKEINHTFTLDAKIDANFNTATDVTRANQDYLFELGSYIQVAHNLYILPAVAYVHTSGVADKAGDVNVNAGDGIKAGVALYYLF